MPPVRPRVISSDGIPDNELPVDQSSNRVIGTVYQNLTNKSILVIVTTKESITAKGDKAHIDIISDENSIPTTILASHELQSTDAVTNLALDLIESTSFIVPPTFYYQVTSSDTGTGASTLVKCIETSLG